MATHPQVDCWLSIASALLRNLVPKGAGPEIFGCGLQPDAFSALVDREQARVDHALVAMAVARGETEVKAIAAQLGPDTLIALFSRWAHYMQAWQAMKENPRPHLWVPPKTDQIWRAVFLAMTSEGIHSTAAARSLWPEVFGDADA